MLVTIIGEGNRKELLYGEHKLIGDPPIYDVSEEKIDLIRTCTVDKIQEVINIIVSTSKIIVKNNIDIKNKFI